MNENNVALISPRRIGKTDLIWHVFDDQQIRKSHYYFIVDIYATKNLSDLVNLLGKAVIDELRPKGRKAWEKFIAIVSSVRFLMKFVTVFTRQNATPSALLNKMEHTVWQP